MIDLGIVAVESSPHLCVDRRTLVPRGTPGPTLPPLRINTQVWTLSFACGCKFLQHGGTEPAAFSAYLYGPTVCAQACAALLVVLGRPITWSTPELDQAIGAPMYSCRVDP